MCVCTYATEDNLSCQPLPSTLLKMVVPRLAILQAPEDSQVLTSLSHSRSIGALLCKYHVGSTDPTLPTEPSPQPPILSIFLYPNEGLLFLKAREMSDFPLTSLK